MHNIIIITGHGTYASGIKGSLEMLSGLNDSIYMIDFTSDDTEITLRDKFLKIINDNKDSNFLFVCDLIGGTPYKESFKLAFENSNIKVVTGANLGGIIDSKLKMQSLDFDALAHNMVEASKKNLMLLEASRK